MNIELIIAALNSRLPSVTCVIVFKCMNVQSVVTQLVPRP